MRPLDLACLTLGFALFLAGCGPDDSTATNAGGSSGASASAGSGGSGGAGAAGGGTAGSVSSGGSATGGSAGAAGSAATGGTGGSGSAAEVCDDKKDNDGDGLFDCEDSDCFNDAAACPLMAECDAVPITDLEPGKAYTLNIDVASMGTRHFAGKCGGAGLYPGAIFAAKAGVAGTLTIMSSTSGNVDAVVYARSTCADPFTELTCADGGPGKVEGIQLHFVAGQTFWVFIDCTGASSMGTLGYVAGFIPDP